MATIAGSLGLIAHTESARGAALWELLVATGVGGAGFGLLLAIGVLHRMGRTTILDRLGALASRLFPGAPPALALASVLVIGTLVPAGVGYYWDVATHIDKGRDIGVFTNPGHYPILLGLAGITAAGLLVIIMGTPKAGRYTVRLGHDWHVPAPAFALLACGAFGLAGFPLDDTWHRLFGQDVTLWGPTHVLMIAGGSMATLSLWLLRARPREIAEPTGSDRPAISRSQYLWEVVTAGSFLVGMSTLQAEFDFGIPQFRMVFHPLIIALAAGLALVAARVRLGRGAALYAALIFIVIRAAFAIFVDGMDRVVPHFPLYLAEALAVEAAALLVSTRRTVRFGALAGLLVGTVGTAAEWGWSQAWMPLPWNGALFPEVAVLAPAMGIAAGILGAAVGACLNRTTFTRTGTIATACAGGVVIACLAWPMPMTATLDATATVVVDERPGERRTGDLAITITPASAVEDVEYLNVTAWQGGGFVLDRLRRTGAGSYVTTQPIPLDGEWKAMVRMQRGREVLAAPIFLPKDDVIPVPEIPATASFTRPFERDSNLLRREEVGGSTQLRIAAYLVLMAIAALWIASMTWALARTAAHGQDEQEPLDPGNVPTRVRVSA